MTTFDTLSKRLSAPTTRRTVLGRLAATAGIIGLAFAASVTPASASTKKACARLGQPCGAAVTDTTRYPTVCCPGLACSADGHCVAA